MPAVLAHCAPSSAVAARGCTQCSQPPLNRPRQHPPRLRTYLCRFKEAIKECNQGLAVEGTNETVLKCRAHARYESGLFKDALHDIQKINSGNDKNTEDAEFEQKVRSALTGKQSQNGSAENTPVNGTIANNDGSAPQAAGAVRKKKEPVTQEQTATMLRATREPIVCKATLEGETKYLHVPFGISYFELQQTIKGKWTGLHNFKIYYLDKDSEWVLMTCRRDVQRAQHEIIQYAQRVFNQRQRQGLESAVRRFTFDGSDTSGVCAASQCAVCHAVAQPDLACMRCACMCMPARKSSQA